MKWIELVHDGRYILRFEAACLSGKSMFDSPDNQVCYDTYETALLAVGGILDVVSRVMEGELDNAFCASDLRDIMPKSTRPWGFAISITWPLPPGTFRTSGASSGLELSTLMFITATAPSISSSRIRAVFYYSIHEHPSFAYPGTGREFEIGRNSGHGFTKNSPVLPGQGDDEYKRLMQKDLIPAFDEFKPEVILVSVGFDAHADDDMSDMKLSTEGFSWIMQRIVELGRQHSKGRVISVILCPELEEILATS